MRINHTADYRKCRAKEYPDVGDQLDALWKVLQANPTVSIPEEAQGVVARIGEVKRKFPKR